MNKGKFIVRILLYFSFIFVVSQIYVFINVPFTLEYMVPLCILNTLGAIYVFYDIFFD